MHSMKLAGFALALLGGSLVARPALACSIQLIDAFGVEISDTAPQSDLPSLTVESWTVDRGCGRNGGSGNCADVGTLELVVGPAAELFADQGVHIRVVTGEAPMGELDGAISAHQDGLMHFPWGDGAGQPAFDFSITVQAVDDQGRVGAVSDPIQIQHGGGSPCLLGCACVSSEAPLGARLAGALLALGLFIGALGLRRR